MREISERDKADLIGSLPDHGLEVFYPCLHGRAGSWIDRSQNANNATITSGDWARRPGGLRGILLDGGTDRLQLGTRLNIATGTVLAWVTVDSFIDGQQTIFTQDVAGQNDGDFTLDIENTTDKFQLRQQEVPGVTKAIYGNTAITPPETHHVAVLFGVGGMYMFVDGVQQTDDDPFEGGITVNTTAYIGGLAGAYSWSGFIGYFAVLTTRLTPALIAGLYGRQRRFMGP